MKISLYQNIKNTIPKIGAKDVFQVLESIKDGTYKNNVASIRIETDKELRNQLKAKLHYVTFCGVFSTRSNSNLKKASGLACLDFDAVDDLNELRELIDKDTFTFRPAPSRELRDGSCCNSRMAGDAIFAKFCYDAVQLILRHPQIYILQFCTGGFGNYFEKPLLN